MMVMTMCSSVSSRRLLERGRGFWHLDERPISQQGIGEFIDSLACILAGADFKAVVQAIVAARAPERYCLGDRCACHQDGGSPPFSSI